MKQAIVTKEVLKKQFLEAVPKDYYLELNVGVVRYDDSSTYDLLTCVMSNRAKLDDHIVKEKKESEEILDLTLPIDTYFNKMEDCQKLDNDGKVPISKAKMVPRLQTHISATGLVNSRYLKWKEKPLLDRTWALTEIIFLEALSGVRTINKMTTSEAGLTANAAVSRTTVKADIRAEMQSNLGEYVDTLACAATIKSNTIDALCNSLAEVTTANFKLTTTKAELSAIILKLANQLTRASNNNNSRRNGRNNNNNNNNTSTDNNKWPDWCDPDAYCHTCGYKVRKGRGSVHCTKAKDTTDHKVNVTPQNMLGGSKLHTGFGNKPNEK